MKKIKINRSLRSEQYSIEKSGAETSRGQYNKVELCRVEDKM
jgi:hypothetical protein